MRNLIWKGRQLNFDNQTFYQKLRHYISLKQEWMCKNKKFYFPSLTHPAHLRWNTIIFPYVRDYRRVKEPTHRRRSHVAAGDIQRATHESTRLYPHRYRSAGDRIRHAELADRERA